MKIIQGKEIKGFSFADGTHWYWGDKEVAVINEERREIEWCDRVFKFPSEVVDDIRSRIPTAAGAWIIEARRTRMSAIQGSIAIFVNNKFTGICFEDKIEMNEDGYYASIITDEELGSFVYSCLWHPLDRLYHYSDRFKDIFKPDWRKD